MSARHSSDRTASDAPDRDPYARAFAPILLANLLPLAGVVWLGWEPATLVLIYGIEVLVSLLVAGGTALFAARPPPTDRDGLFTVSDAPLLEKRGTVRPIATLPPIYARNVPFAIAVCSSIVMYAFFFSAVFLIMFGAAGAGAITDLAVLGSVFALVVGQVVETRRQYFGRNAYTEQSPYSVIETPGRQLFVLLFALLVTVGQYVEATGALVLVVCVKLFLEWSTFRADRTTNETNRFVDRFAGWMAGRVETTEPAAPVRVPSEEPIARCRPDRTAVALDGFAVALRELAVVVPFGVLIWLAVVTWLAGETGSTLAFVLAAAVFLMVFFAAIAIQAGRYYLAHGPLEYQRRGDRLVVYDRLLEEFQWAEPIDGLRDVALVPDRFADQVLGTRTIAVTAGWGETETERTLGPVTDPDQLVKAFDLPLASTALDPIDRRLAAGAVGLGGAIVVAGCVLLVVPGQLADTRIEAVFALMVSMLVPYRLWKRACPDPD